MKRETGFYWVMLGDEWMIAEYYQPSHCWYITGSSLSLYDKAFKAIDETKIEKVFRTFLYETS